MKFAFPEWRGGELEVDLHENQRLVSSAMPASLHMSSILINSLKLLAFPISILLPALPCFSFPFSLLSIHCPYIVLGFMRTFYTTRSALKTMHPHALPRSLSPFPIVSSIPLDRIASAFVSVWRFLNHQKTDTLHYSALAFWVYRRGTWTSVLTEALLTGAKW